jgi:hypothetical protein
MTYTIRRECWVREHDWPYFESHLETNGTIGMIGIPSIVYMEENLTIIPCRNLRPLFEFVKLAAP